MSISIRRHVEPLDRLSGFVPVELTCLRQWVNWRFEVRNDKRTKVPYRSDRRGLASTTDSSTWATFEEASQAYEQGGFDGIGFVFAKDGGMVGIDLDNCMDNGVICPEAQAIIDMMDTYTEVSPSGCGVKLWCFATMPDDSGGRNTTKVEGFAKLEMYPANRFFTVTGQHVDGSPMAVEHRTREVADLFHKYFGATRVQANTVQTADEPITSDDVTLIKRIRQSDQCAKFNALWDGDTSAYDGDDSAADLALCSILTFWIGPDVARIDRVFRQSGLFREKWNRDDYRRRTISKSLEGRTEFFSRRTGRSGRSDEQTPSKLELSGHLTDIGNAERLITEHGDDLRYCPEQQCWYVWDGQRWTVDRTGEVERRAKATIRGMYAVAANMADYSQRMALVHHARASESNARVRAMIERARAEPGVTVRLCEFDTNPMLFNCANGTVELTRGGRLRPHDRRDLITKLSPVRFDLEARSENWEHFLHQVTAGDRLVQDFLQRAVGYSLTGLTEEEVLFFVHGPGATGKSTFIEAIKAVFGEYAMTADFETFVKRSQVGGPRNDVARLTGARFVASIEVDEGKKLAEGLVKALTGGDVIAARALYREAFEYRPTFKLWLVANHAPHVNDDDSAMWRRILRVPFDQVIAKERRDPHIKVELTDPSTAGPAILAWAVRGCIEWQKKRLAIPDRIAAATEIYRQDQDPLADFLDDCCNLDTAAMVTAAEIWKTYESWCVSEGQQVRLGRKEFGSRLTRRGCRADRAFIGGSTQRVWTGIGLVDMGLRTDRTDRTDV